MTKRLLLLIILLLAAVRSGEPQERRTFTKDMRFQHFHSEVMSQERSMLVMLPPGYDEAKEKRYPVLYMHDGQSVFVNWRIDELTQPLFTNGQMQPIIIVAIFNGDSQEERFNDYTPTRDSRFAKSGNADAYGRMIVEELKPIIDAEYRTLPDQANTGIGGTSLGGLVSIYLALKYPATFGKAAVMSPSVWWDNQMIVREVKRINAKPPVKVWLDVGTEEGSRSIAETKALRDALLEKGWKRDSDLKYFEAKGAEHNEKAFARRAPEVLKYLFPAKPDAATARSLNKF